MLTSASGSGASETTKAVKVFLEDPETILILQPGVRVFVDGLDILVDAPGIIDEPERIRLIDLR